MVFVFGWMLSVTLDDNFHHKMIPRSDLVVLPSYVLLQMTPEKLDVTTPELIL